MQRNNGMYTTDTMARIVSEMIVQTAKNNPIRNEYASRMAGNQFMNQSFHDLVEDCCNFFDLNSYDRIDQQGGVLARAMEDAVAEFLDYEVSAYGLEVASDYVATLPQQQQQRIHQLAHQHAIMMQCIRGGTYSNPPPVNNMYTRNAPRTGGLPPRYGNSQPQPQYGGRMNAFEQHAMRDNQSMGNYQQNMGNDRYGRYQPPQNNRRMISERYANPTTINNQQYQQNADYDPRSEYIGVRQRQRMAKGNVGQPEQRQPATNRYNQQPEQRQPTANRYNQQPTTPPKPAPVEPVKVATKPIFAQSDDGYVKTGPFCEFVRDGETWRPGHKSGWTTPHSNFNYGYDTSALVWFHVKGDDNEVRDEFVKMKTELEYLKHEVTAMVLKTAKTRPPVVNPNEVEFDPLVEVTPKTLADNDIDKSEAVFGDVTSLSEVDYSAKIHRDGQVSKVVTHKVRTSFKVTGDETSATLRCVAGTKTADEAWDVLTAREPYTDRAVFRHVNLKIANDITDILRGPFQTLAVLGDFAESWDKCRDWVADTVKADKFEIFKKMVHAVILNAVRFEDNISDADKAWLAVTAGVNEDTLPKTIQMVENVSAVYIDNDLSELNLLVADDKMTFFGSKTNEVLTDIVRPVVELARQAKGSRIYLLTKEGARIQITTGDERNIYFAKLMH